MNMGDLIGAMLQQGMSGGPTQSRMQSGMRSVQQPGGGLDQLIGALSGGGAGGGGNALQDLARSAGGGGGRSGATGGGGFGDLLGQMMGGGAAGGAAQQGGGGLGDLLGQVLGGGMGGTRSMSGGAPAGGGMGDLLGAVLGGGGGSRSAMGGGAMGMLAGLAVQALQGYMAQQGQPQAAAVDAEQARQLVDEDAERLALRAMLSAAKADGRIDAAESEKLTGQLAKDGVDAEERAFVDAELQRPVAVEALAAEARNPAQAAQIYAASLMAISVDTEVERAYLAALAQALRLQRETVAQLHQMTGAPTI